jgi:arginine-tRNA-protein transferase
MSVIQSPINQQRFYRSIDLPCPYLPGRMESKLFTRLDEGNGAALNSMLTRAGFRRSHNISYRPMCDTCNACQPVRVPAALFTPSRGQRRTLAHNADLGRVVLGAVATRDQYDLFMRYQQSRHAGGDMALMTYEDYTAMVEECTSQTEILEWRDRAGVLKAVMLADAVGDGMSAVYSFFEPGEPSRSLGTFMILELIDEVLRRKRDYLYLGYMIGGMRKMEYKARFRPLEGMTSEGWALMPE